MPLPNSSRQISVTIFDRTTGQGTDVPVFAAALKRKVNTPIQRGLSDGLSPKTLEILGKARPSVRDSNYGGTSSISCADSSGGQTGEFAQGVESLTEYSDKVLPITQSAVWRNRWILFQNFLRETVLVFKYQFLRIKHIDIRLPEYRIPNLRPSIRVHIPKVEIPRYELPRVSMPTISLPKFNFLFFASRFMIVASLVLMTLTVGPMLALQLQSLQNHTAYSTQSLTPKAETPSLMVPADPSPNKQFQIVIPKIGINAKVIANVNPADEKEYAAALKQGVAQAAGSGLPGEVNTANRTIFLFAHSTNAPWNVTRYNALFYKLTDLRAGDSFSVWYKGREYAYTVSQTKVLDASDLSLLEPQTAVDQIVLQTCWPPGTSWKRFIVIAQPQ